MKSAAIILPTIGKPELYDCLQSVLNQSYSNLNCYLVIDGEEHEDTVNAILNKFNDIDPLLAINLHIHLLRNNVGKDGWYGHRVYAAFSLLVNEDYVFYLDEDNILEYNHVESMISRCEISHLDWCYSLRKIIDKEGSVICNDDCESLGKWNPFVEYNHIDTSCYCLSLDVARKFSGAIFGKWGADRQFYSVLNQYAPNYHTTGLYTVKYRLGGNDGSVKREFFLHGNSIVRNNYNDNFPWNSI